LRRCSSGRHQNQVHVPHPLMTIHNLSLRSLNPLFRQSRCLRIRIPIRLQLSRRTFHVSAQGRRQDFDPRTIERESDEVDVCIVGGGPSGLAAAIRLKQLAATTSREIRVILLEKGSEMGTPTMSSLT
jgi:electron-transferring-flavoprotein dehydrogenase